MHISFSKIIKVHDKRREFNFRKLPGDEQFLYHVDVTDDRGNRLMFNMQKNDKDAWITTETALPEWLHDIENILGKVIEEESAIIIEQNHKHLKK